MWIRLRPALSVLALLVALAVAATVAGGVALQDSGPAYTVRERFGIGVAPSWPDDPSFPGLLSDFPNVEQLGFGWYTDWTYRTNPEQPQGIEFVQLIGTRRVPTWPPLQKLFLPLVTKRLSGSALVARWAPGTPGSALESLPQSRWQMQSWPLTWTSLGDAIRANPGALWIAGNEPETRGQGELTPEEYADIYHDVYHFVKGIDPTAQVAIGGVVMPSPLRLQWLDRCLDHYKETYGETMPIDVWNIHMQILREKRYESYPGASDNWGCGIPFGLEEDEGRLYNIVDNCDLDIFTQLITEFCTWLNERGERGKPVIISEYGVLMPSSYLDHGDQDVIDFMVGTFDYMLHTTDRELGWAADGGRLIQRWAWFSLNVPMHYDEENDWWVGFNGWLYDWQETHDFTVFGEAYRDYIDYNLSQ